MAWRGDGKHLAIGAHNKKLFTIHMGDLESKAVGGVADGEVGAKVEEVKKKDGEDAAMEEG